MREREVDADDLAVAKLLAQPARREGRSAADVERDRARRQVEARENPLELGLRKSCELLELAAVRSIGAVAERSRGIHGPEECPVRVPRYTAAESLGTNAGPLSSRRTKSAGERNTELCRCRPG